MRIKNGEKPTKIREGLWKERCGKKKDQKQSLSLSAEARRSLGKNPGSELKN